MEYYTSDDYDDLVKYVRSKLYNLRDVSKEYKLDNMEDNNKHHKHDKLFRKILNDKNEVAKLIKDELEPEEEIRAENLEQYETKYITSRYEERVADVVYKLKDKEVFFLIEHQTKVDTNMMIRILEYTLGILRSRRIAKGKDVKVRVIPIVIYAGVPKWTAKTAFEDMQEEFKHRKGSSSIFRYNLVDIRDVEEAIEIGTALARISVIERVNSTEGIIETIRKFAKVIKDKGERKEFAEEVKYLLSDKLTKKEINKIEDMLIEKEGDDGMLHAQMVIRRDFENVRKKAIEEGMKEGRQKGMKEGRQKGMLDVAKKMLAENFDIDLISKLTGLTKEQFMK